MMALRKRPTSPRADDLDARCRRVRGRILDAIEETLDELAQPATQRAAMADTLWAHAAPLLCRQTSCGRAKRCRRKPCIVPRAAAAGRASSTCRRNRAATSSPK